MYESNQRIELTRMLSHLECAEMKFFSFHIRWDDNFVARKNRIEKNTFLATSNPLLLMGLTPECMWNMIRNERWFANEMHASSDSILLRIDER